MEIIEVFAIPIGFGVVCYVLDFIWEIIDPINQ